jgi:hypothetical protein
MVEGKWGCYLALAVAGEVVGYVSPPPLLDLRVWYLSHTEARW